MAYIGSEPIVGNFQVCDAISVVNGQAAYTMQVSSTNVVPESVNHMLVSLNGILQKPGSSFTISGSTITFASALATGDVIDFIMLLGNVLDIGVPSDATVTDAKANFVSTSSGAGLQIKGDGTTDGTLQLNCSQNSHGIKLKSPAHSAGQSYTLTFPTTAPSSGSALITDGSGNLSFGSAGGLVKLSSTTLSSTASSIDFTSSIITSTHDAYYFTILVSPETDNASIEVRLSDGGSFNTGSSDYGHARIADSGSGTSSNGASSIVLIDGTDNSFANAYHGELTLLYPSNSSTKTVVNFKGHRNDGDPALFTGGGQRLNAEATDGIRFFFNSGDISVGSTITCYGIVK